MIVPPLPQNSRPGAPRSQPLAPPLERRASRFPRPTPVFGLILWGALSARAWDLATDVRPLPDAQSPVAITASPFHVWIATREALSRWSRIGDDAPVWFGQGHGLPTSGIASICWDDPSSALLVQGRDGRTFQWSEATQQTRELPGKQGCSNPLARTLAPSRLPPLTPEPDGWMSQAGDLIEPGGRHASIVQAVLLDEKELWLATTNAGVWKGRLPSGRIQPMSSGLGETCIREAVRTDDGALWLLGCTGRLGRLDRDGSLVGMDPRSPRWRDARDARHLAPSAEGDGVVVGTLGGAVEMSEQGIFDRWMRRKAPPGGPPEILARWKDTLWCLGSNTLSRSIRGGAFETIPLIDSSGERFRITTITPAAGGLLAGTPDGFRLFAGDQWLRPPSLVQARSRLVRRVAFDPATGRIAWSDGDRIRVDTLPGGSGPLGSWSPPSGTIRDLAWDTRGRLHLAHGDWSIWNPRDETTRTWSMPVSVELVVPGESWTFLGGTTGGLEARNEAWAP
ncbi:MAG: hypothetical protein H6686_02285 [Fibrobacteria bacterium]|nr:hypothetical protein [Fibrobacteria bacterium]